MFKTLTINDEKARQLEYCPKCKQKKSKGLIVCWECFKGGKHPFKYHKGSLKSWLKLK